MATQNKTSSKPSLRGGTTKQSHEATTNQPHDATVNNKQIALAKKPRKDVPKLRFKEFVDKWEEKFYGDIYSFYTTNSFSRDNLNYEKGKVKNIHYGDIHTKFSMLFDIKKELVPFINEEINLTKIKEEYYCQEGDLVIADASEDYNDIGKTIELTNLNNEKILAGLHTFLARPNKHKMQKGFAGYLVQSWKARKQVMTIAQGTKVLGIATGRLAKVKLDIPKLPEQQKIANFLTTVDTKLQQLTTKKEKLAQYKKGVMQQLFSQQLRFKANGGSAFPDWEEKKLGEIFKFKQGFQFPVEEQFDEPFDNSVYFIRIVNVTSSPDNKRYVIKPEEQHILSENDLFMVRYGDAGKIATGFNGIIANNMFRLLPKIKISEKWFYFYLDSIYEKIHALAGSSTMPAIKFGTIENLKVNTPSLKEQQKIANYLTAIDAKIAAAQIQLTNTQQFKKGLLQQLFV
jgi:type I restriction enzyme S subunit